MIMTEFTTDAEMLDLPNHERCSVGVFNAFKPADHVEFGAPLAARITVSLVEFRAD